MEDKSFYLSDLALEMIVLSQDIPQILLPVSGVLKDTSQEEMIKELYSLVSNGIMENDEKNNCFALNKDLATLLKTVIGSQSVLRVSDLRYAHNPVYCYLSGDSVTVIEAGGFHSGIKLSGISSDDLNERIFKNLNITENAENVSSDIEEVESGKIFPEEMLSTDIEDLRKGFDDIEGCVDIISCENFDTVCRILVFKKSSEYKIAVLTEDKTLVCDYTYQNFCRVTEKKTGEKL